MAHPVDAGVDHARGHDQHVAAAHDVGRAGHLLEDLPVDQVVDLPVVGMRVATELVEAMVLFRWSAKNAPVQLAAAIARGKELHRWRKELTDAEFFHRRTNCPFLVRGRCSVYAARPHPCRTHYMGGNPLKCRDELQPAETYAMDPDSGLFAEAKQIADDLKFFALIDDVVPTELSELLYYLDRLATVPKWKKQRKLDWQLVGE